MAQAEQRQTESVAGNGGGVSLSALPRRYVWIGGVALVALVALICFAFWGPSMDFPTTISTSTTQVPTSGGGTATLEIERTLGEATAQTIDDAVRWVVQSGKWLFDPIKAGITHTLNAIEGALHWLPWPALGLGIALLAFAAGGWRLLVITAVGLLFIGFMDLWANAIDTVALMAVAVFISVALGLPLGILAARNSVADGILRPILDGMQTMPSFVYLLPGILLFNLGKPAGIFATIIYAVPPVIRLTNLGIRQVPEDTIEAAHAFGSSPLQTLVKVQIPMALPTIMAGINQTTMMALAMVTIASMVAAGGLGDNVLRALQKNQPGNGLIAGLAIVFLAIIIDRLTQSIAQKQERTVSAG